MEIPKKMLSRWKILRSPEDVNNLVDKMSDSYPELFNRAFRTGKCNNKVFEVMAKYYAKKANLIKEYL